LIPSPDIISGVFHRKVLHFKLLFFDDSPRLYRFSLALLRGCFTLTGRYFMKSGELFVRGEALFPVLVCLTFQILVNIINDFYSNVKGFWGFGGAIRN
jgi:hypothetical protein